ncbi:MAG TPA: tol-pal system protein YbgF [Arenimonas sp.]|nr:tol-pal system protein YbgF [Arenimonas sp.]
MSARRSLAVVTVAAALVAAAPAFGQRASLADRVTRLEQHQAEQMQGAGQANIDLLNRVTQLQSEVAALRSQIEQLQYDNEQLKQRNREQYIDLDSRLARLEGGAAPTADASSIEPDAPAAPTAEPAPASEGIVAGVANAPATPTTPSDPVAAEAAYSQALDTLVQRFEAADAARQFQAFVRDYADSPLVPNAWYWLGESYYVTQNYDLAAEAFETTLAQFPGSRKEADAMLKLAYCRIGLGQMAAAEAGLRELIARYPGTDAASKGESRLHTLLRDGR